MRKKAKFILTCISVILCLSMFIGCEKNKEFTENTYISYVTNMANDGLLKKIDKDWWNGARSKRDNAEKNKTVKHKDTEFKGEYQDSYVRNNNWYVTDRYKTEDNKTFYLRADNGQFLGYFDISEQFDSMEISLEAISDPHNNAVKKAKEIASQYVDISKYTMKEDEPSEYSLKTTQAEGKTTLYTFEFIKQVAGFDTNDTVYVEVSAKGQVRTLKISNTGEFDKINNFNVDVEKLNKAIEEKMQDLYGDYASYNYVITEQTLTYTPENNLAIVSLIELTVNTGETTINSGVVLTTVIGTVS